MATLMQSAWRSNYSPALFVITYDLRISGQDYDGLRHVLADEMRGIRIQQSTWWVASLETAAELRNRLLPFVDYNDSLMVGRLSDVAGYESHPQIRAWIEAYLAACAAA